MTGPGPSDPAAQEPAQEPAPPPADPNQPAAGWGQQPAGNTAPAWAQQAQQWKPAAVAAGPAPGIGYADLGPRVIAYIVDAIILGIVTAIIDSILISALFFSGGFGVFLLFIIAGVVNLAIGAVYFVYCWTTMKATVGQKLLGLMTVNDTDGSALTQMQAITRWAVMFAPSVLAIVAQQVLFGILGLLISLAGLGWTIYLLYTTANDPRRQGFHDKMAHSVVVKPAA